MQRFALFFCLLLCGFAPPKMVKVKIANGITIMIPKDWRAMDGLDFNERYPSVRAPLAAYTNPERLVDFSVNISATQWPDTDIEMAKGFFKASILNTFDKVDILSEGVRDYRGKKLIYFEFNSRINGVRKQEELRNPVLQYSYIQYYIESGRTLVFAFNCPTRLQPEWQETAKKMMHAIKLP